MFDIYHAVRAEGLSAGEWYSGTVTLADIDELFRRAEKRKAVELVPDSSRASERTVALLNNGHRAPKSCLAELL